MVPMPPQHEKGAGCQTEDILDRMGLKMADLFREEEKGQNGTARGAKGGRKVERPRP